MNWFEVVFMYSFMIASSLPALLFFQFLNTFSRFKTYAPGRHLYQSCRKG